MRFQRHFGPPVSLGLLGLLVLAHGANAQMTKSPPPRGATTHTAVIGERYDNGGLNRFFYGGGYRDIWAAPVEMGVLDLETTAGGLTPFGTGGYGQTVSLKLLGADGLEYAVRSIDKDPTRRLDSLFTGTVIARIVQDQVGQFLPTAGLVVDPLLEATGILHPRHRLVVIPDDPGLGEYREDFAGMIGMLTDNPQEGPDNTPGFAGSRRVSGSENVLEALEEGACNRADARGYLKARLMDMVLGDRDRHAGQFRWARFPEGPEGCYVWQVVPEDRDQAFIMNDGLMMSMFRLVRPQQVKFGDEFPSLVGLTFNGWELDRQILVELDEPVWQEVAEEIQRELTDDVIDDAVRQLPDPHYQLRGPFLETALKSRRDLLVPEALDFYRLITKQSEITATDRDEHAVFEHLENGDLRVTIRYADGLRSDRPYYDRTFSRDVANEVRLFLRGGDDLVEVTGAGGNITVRAIGGGGDDRYVNRSAAGGTRTRFYDDRGDNEFEGRARTDDRSYEKPPSNNLVHKYALDWGGFNRYIPQLRVNPDLGLYAGVEIGFQRFGFRRFPWATDNAFTVALATNGPEPFLGWVGRFREAVARADLVFDLSYSGLEILHFYGFGNETASADGSEFFTVDQQVFEFAPVLQWSWGHADPGQEVDLRLFRPRTTFGVGPVVKYANTPVDDNSDRFITTIDPPPLGLGTFGQVGARAWLGFDTRDSPGYPTKGLQLEVGGAAYGGVWDAEEAFGELHGALATYLTPGGRRTPTLALRASAKSVFGEFPYYEAASLGGSSSVRGLRSGRFAGDVSAFGNAEIRLPVAQFQLLFPAEFGIQGAADVGRVWVDGDTDDSDVWHSSFGGGIWLSFLNRAQTLSLYVMNGDDITGIYFGAGMSF